MDSLDAAIQRLRRVVVDSAGVDPDSPELSAAAPDEFYQVARQLPRAGGKEDKAEGRGPRQTPHAEAPGEALPDPTPQGGIPRPVKRGREAPQIGEAEGFSPHASSARAERGDPADVESAPSQPPPTCAESGEATVERKSEAPEAHSKNFTALGLYIFFFIVLLILLSWYWIGK